MKRFIFIFLLFLVFSGLATTQESTGDEPSIYDQLVPGYYQFTHGDPALGVLSSAGYLTNLSMTGLLLANTNFGSETTEYWVERDGQHYFAYSDLSSETYQNNRWVSGVALSSGLWGGLFTVYGKWNMFLNTSASPRLKRQLNLTLGDYILAPFHPENVFNTDVFPALPLLNPALYNFSNYQKIGAFFQRESVPFISWKVSPLAGLGLTAATSTVIVMANATLEEIYFRGGSLAKYGTIGSSALFGVNHLLNAFAVPNFSFENAGMQGLWAFFFGLYAANRTDANDGDFRRMIALHYWYNVSEIIFNYLISPETPVLFQITIPLTSF